MLTAFCQYTDKRGPNSGVVNMRVTMHEVRAITGNGAGPHLTTDRQVKYISESGTCALH